MPEGLSSWRDGAAKEAAHAFVERMTQPLSSAYVAAKARMARFDNDGTYSRD